MSEYAILASRSIRLTRRNPDAVITALVLPVLLMLVFVYFFGGAIETSTGTYVTYVAPGVLILCAGYGASMTATTVTNDMTGGIIDRFRSMDTSSTAVLAGHVAASVARNAAATAAVLGVAFAIGFRPHADTGQWLAAVSILLAYITTLSWLGAAAGLLAKTPEAAGGFTFVMLFLPYPSSAFVPVETMPAWLHGFAENQPVTPVIEALRALLLDQPAGNSPWLALAWCGGLLAVALPVCAALYRRRTA
ncbi:ABC transporter permease [Streptomyces tubbatahanensis]|uniref:Transport permease protein n=1 Tax=Streptomyces tubbatahanensis TaxID=2923272 RepID=A0ABY3XRA5_9ACTN|nr:ABC transporter permease [Streptomyces tubbatahanensis]UNS96936.1 ABC transporter permease [Streptomyces tubbatahanensis]